MTKALRRKNQNKVRRTRQPWVVNGRQAVEEEHDSLVFGVVLYCVGIRIVEQQRAAFLPSIPHVTNVHKAAFRLWRNDQPEMTAHQPFRHAVVRGNDFAGGEDGKKGVLKTWDAIE